ncbi:unnamed protein product [Closterium sp. Naga37s-1]|nr:unnamed protein product [Closterium sp. Naga37s-1]
MEWNTSKTPVILLLHSPFPSTPLIFPYLTNPCRQRKSIHPPLFYIPLLLASLLPPPCLLTASSLPPYCLLLASLLPPPCLLTASSLPPYCLLLASLLPPPCLLNASSLPLLLLLLLHYASFPSSPTSSIACLASSYPAKFISSPLSPPFATPRIPRSSPPPTPFP